ncbi:MAG TPA: hypothetical protein PKC09_06285 [Paracoccus sp. (in: a-proteobacteria)]|uniref:hypothetical protein n=1 Tax=uncultured Paracoccus sp. TaxID=189685 RepID=UPI00260E7D15|nr:hypothetical protein [uncultured Paracoccus sp.]HMQ40868.1 hypothetical protein [Paracoccus sp. (in: a-proteobacteria)]HMR35028.1 hypothetical protein [Paracoccus sp. (in: a-proteobacteria)]
MTKTVTDHERSTGSGRVRAYVSQDRQSGTHPAVTALHRRPHEREGDDSRKTSEYARIERGHEV